MEQIELIDGIAKIGDKVMWYDNSTKKVMTTIIESSSNIYMHQNKHNDTTPSFLTLDGLKKYCAKYDVKIEDPEYVEQNELQNTNDIESLINRISSLEDRVNTLTDVIINLLNSNI